MGRIHLIKQVFHIRNYWEVIVFYNVDYNLFYDIEELLLDCGASIEDIEGLYYMMRYNNALAVTFSNTKLKVSIVLFNEHKTKQSYINSIVHEAEHVKQAVLRTYNVDDRGEDAAYTIGFIVGQMYRGFYFLMCNCSKP